MPLRGRAGAAQADCRGRGNDLPAASLSNFRDRKQGEMVENSRLSPMIAYNAVVASGCFPGQLFCFVDSLAWHAAEK